CYSRSKRHVELSRGVFLHRRRDVAVEVKGHGYRRMPEALLRHLRMDAGLQELRRMAMAKIMKPNLWYIFDLPYGLAKLVRQAPRRHRLSVHPSADKGIAGLANAEF